MSRRVPPALARPLAVLTSLALGIGLLMGLPAPAQADDLNSLTLVNGNATGRSISLSAEPTPYLFTGIGNAADDTINVLATFTGGTASVTVAVGSGAASAPVSVVSGVETPVPLSSGTNDIVVTHVGTTTTSYTLRIYRSFPITGFEIINADDSSVIISKTGGSFDLYDRDDTALVPYGVSRIRARMFYATPTEASALPAQALIWTGCVGCSFNTVTSGEWSPITNLGAGANNVSFYSVVEPWWNYRGTAWNVQITRQAAFNANALESLALVNANGTGGSVNLNPEATPYLFTGIANAADDTINVLATFSTGTASVSVTVGAGAPSAPVTVVSGVETAVPLTSGTNDIVVTHVGATTTSYTLRVYRSFPIKGFEIINADDSTVIISRTGSNFSVTDQDDTAVLTHDVYRIRARMFYDTPTEASALPIEGLIWSSGVGSGFTIHASGEWTDIRTLGVGETTTAFYPVVAPWWNYRGTAWNVRITRASAFASISSVSLPGVPSVGTPVPSGTTITVNPVGVTGTPPPTVTYDWEATESIVNPDWELIESTTSPTFTPDNDVANQYIRVTATADNGVSTPVTVSSTPFGPIAEVDEAPRFRETVTVTGSANVGATLTASTGRVTGRPAPTLAYQWEIADDSASAFAPISGAIGSTYRPVSADADKIIRVVVTAANGIGSDATGTSAATSPIGTAAPPPPGGGTPREAPGAPLDIEAQAGLRSAMVSWAPPASPGDFGITTYRVIASTGERSCIVPVGETSCRVRKLPAGVPVTFTVKALSGAGWGQSSAESEEVTPLSPREVPVELTGTREGRLMTLSGAVAHFRPGTTVVIRIRLAERGKFVTARRSAVLGEDGTFTWTRRIGPARPVYAFAIIRGARSEIVILPVAPRS